jgi:uncharacterized membrane protein
VSSPDRAVPRLANETFRSLIVAAISLPLTFVIPFALFGFDLDYSQLVVATLFVWWTFVCILGSALHVSVFARATPAELRHWFLATRPRTRWGRIGELLSGGGATGWAITGSFIAVLAVLALSLNADFRVPVLVYSGIAVVLGSLVLTITSYAVRYGRAYAETRALEFPGDKEPRFADFLYLSVQASTTFSTSDVTVTDTRTRVVVTVHSLIAFVFNTVIVALLVSVLVSTAS